MSIKTYSEFREEVACYTRQRLEESCVDGLYNGFLEEPLGEHGLFYEAIPHFGFWRRLGFYRLEFPIGRFDDGTAGLCTSNKWGVPTRKMTSHEALEFVALIDAARAVFDVRPRTSVLQAQAAVAEFVASLRVETEPSG